MSSADNLEVYVNVRGVERLVSFLDGEIGDLSFDSSEDGISIYMFGHSRVFIWEGLHGEYVFVQIYGVSRWPSNVQLARDVAAKLGVSVRCDPGPDNPNISPYSNVFFEVDLAGERFVEWG